MSPSSDASCPVPAGPPGARASWIFGTLALGCAIGSFFLVWLAVDPLMRPYILLAIPALLMFILAVPMGILAVVFGLRARRRARREPDAFKASGGAGCALGFFAMGVWTLVLLFLLPVLTGQGRSPRARDRAIVSNMRDGLAELATTYEKAAAEGLSEDRRVQALEALIASWPDRRNPWNRKRPWLNPRLLASGPGEAAAEAEARQRASVLGEAVFVLSSPVSGSEERWLAGAVLTQSLTDASPRPGGGERIISKSTRLGP